jgi:hypothetical protein
VKHRGGPTRGETLPYGPTPPLRRELKSIAFDDDPRWAHLQHQMLTSQMFTFMSGCLGQLFQQSGLQLPQPPTSAELQADPTAPLPPVGGFVNVPLATFPHSPLLQTGAFAVPQTTTPQAAVTSSFLAQLQMTTLTSSQLVSLLTTRALVFDEDQERPSGRWMTAPQ